MLTSDFTNVIGVSSLHQLINLNVKSAFSSGSHESYVP